MKLHSSFLILLLVNVTILALVADGCNSPTQATSGLVSMTSIYTASAFPVALSKFGSGSSLLTVDSIKITRARFVLKEIKLKTSTDSANFKDKSFVLALGLNGVMQDIAVAGVPFGTYRKIEFKVHRVDSSDIRGLFPAETAQFADFLSGEKYSIIIEGVLYKDGQSGQAFTYRSKIDAVQKYDLMPELVVSESNPNVNVTMKISSFNWFKNSSGVLLDPSDTNNEGQIDENLKNAIKLYKDNDRDGNVDSN